MTRRLTSRLLPILWCCGVFFAGCAYVTIHSRFSEVVATDYQGNVVAVWTAVDDIKPVEGGVEILAVERKKPDLVPYEARYVIGRRVRVLAPNIAVYRVRPPEWMRRDVAIIERPPSEGTK